MGLTGGHVVPLSSEDELAAQKARREKILADRDEIELEIVRKNLVVRDDVHKVAFESSRRLRDSLYSLCKQAAPELSGMTAPEKIESRLRDEIDMILEEFIRECV